MKKKLYKICLAAFIAVACFICIYGWYLSATVEKRFSSRRWSLPSKVFTDTMLLYPGQHLDVRLFRQKLKRVGYREVPRRPAVKGEMRVTPDNIVIFLRDLATPWEKREGFPVDIAFSRDSIVSMTRNDTAADLPLVEIDPEEIALFFGPERERRKLVSIDQVPEHVIHAFMAAEDTHFFHHWGIDPRGILRAMITNLRHGRIRQGGSTITQQLAKNYFLTSDRSFKRKLQEALLAVILELKFSKEVILEIYLNEIYFGQEGSVSINGIGEAAEFYFGEPVSKLSISEAAALAGLIKGPNLFSPYVHADACHKRKNQVLASMLKNNWITDETFQAERKVTVKPVGYSVYGNKAPYFVDYLHEQLMALYRPEDLASLGMSIYTTLDSQVQMAAEQALRDGLHNLERRKPALKRDAGAKQLQGAVVVMQPKTGHILAMAGGRNYNESQFNRITQAHRQAGSAFKPIVFLTGLDTVTPITLLANEPKVYQVDGRDWTPKNFEPEAEKQVTVRKALENSYNLAAIDLAMKVGLDRIIDTAAAFGFTTRFKPYPSLALGAFEVIPLELAHAYSIFASGGLSAFPLALKAVSDENGRLLEQRYLAVERKISPQKAFMINSLLRGVVDNGTARAIRAGGIDWPVAGKTGTTNDYRDAWFIGYTPDILALVWVGFDNGDPIGFTGSGAALPIWTELMRAIPQYISQNDFRMPKGIVKRSVCADTGRTGASIGCSKTYEEYFLAENAPLEKTIQEKGSGFFNKILKGITTIFKGE